MPTVFIGYNTRAQPYNNVRIFYVAIYPHFTFSLSSRRFLIIILLLNRITTIISANYRKVTNAMEIYRSVLVYLDFFRKNKAFYFSFFTSEFK